MIITEVYDALYTLIKAVSVPATPVYQLDAKALVIPCYTLDGPREQWGAQLKSGLDAERIHAWFFTQTDTLQPDRRNRGGQLYGEWVITLYGYLEKQEGTFTANSDRTFQLEANAIERAINADPTTLVTVLQSMRPFKLSRDVDFIGGKSVHVAVGDIIVRSC